MLVVVGKLAAGTAELMNVSLFLTYSHQFGTRSLPSSDDLHP